MNESLHLSSVARVVEELLESSAVAQRDRILLDAVFALEAAAAAAIWRQVPSWRSVLERGPVDALPQPSLVAGVLEDDLDRNLPGRGVVLRPTGSGLALVLGEVENPDGRVDLLEALLHLTGVLADTVPGGTEGLSGPLPEPDPGLEGGA